MYCVNCGVELADSEKKCPLCGMPVFHPDIPRTPAEPPFPPTRRIRPEAVLALHSQGEAVSYTHLTLPTNSLV